MSYQDRTITCVECGEPFTFTAGEQEFYAQKGFANEPKRCPTHRAARRNGGSFTSGSGGGDYDRPQRQLYPAVCARCGKETEVPFQPRGDRPVYCRDCFQLVGARTQRY